MQIGDTKYSIGTNNWKNRTPVLLKFSCDLLVLISLIMSTIWTDVELVLQISVALKLLSNFISEHMPQEVQSTIANSPETNV